MQATVMQGSGEKDHYIGALASPQETPGIYNSPRINNFPTPLESITPLESGLSFLVKAVMVAIQKSYGCYSKKFWLLLKTLLFVRTV